jgi:hypothetical protein
MDDKSSHQIQSRLEQLQSRVESDPAYRQELLEKLDRSSDPAAAQLKQLIISGKPLSSRPAAAAGTDGELPDEQLVAVAGGGEIWEAVKGAAEIGWHNSGLGALVDILTS